MHQSVEVANHPSTDAPACLLRGHPLLKSFTLAALNTLAPNSTDDAALLRQIAAGQNGALATLYDKHAGLMYSVLFNKLEDAAESQDIVHDVFLKLHAKAGLYGPGHGEPIAWLLTIARNAAIDRLRRRATHRRYIQNTMEAAEPVEATTSDSNTLYDDEVAALQDCINILSGSQKETLQLAYFGGHTQQEIADQLSQPLGSVKAWIRRGLLKLKDCVQAKL